MGKKNLVRIKRIIVEEDNENAEQNRENLNELFVEMLYQHYKKTKKEGLLYKKKGEDENVGEENVDGKG